MRGLKQNKPAISNDSLRPIYIYSWGILLESNKVEIVNICYRIALCIFDITMDELNT